MTLEDYNTEMMNTEMNAGGNTDAVVLNAQNAENLTDGYTDAETHYDDFAAKVNAALNELDKLYSAVPPGTYIVDIQNISYGVTMKGIPKVCTKMKITDGEYAGRTMYFTNVLSSPVGVAILIRNLRKLATDLVIEYNSDVEFRNLVEVLGAEVATNTIPTWYRVKKSVNSRGFSSFEIVGIVDDLPQ